MPTLSFLRFVPLALLLCAGAAQAASDGSAREHYLQDRQACMSGHTWQARETCLREAGAAQQAARRGNLTSSDAERLESNAMQRCEVFKSTESRAACVARVRDSGSGSVPEGGLLRESTITTITPVSQ